MVTNSTRTEIDELAQKIRASTSQSPQEVKLSTSERVLKRITDGIYRRPSSAIRELIANAYDADATKVVVETDKPRFSSISIRDDGNGFTEEALASMICNIGGSPKRTADGATLGVTKAGEPDLSPGGRRLIGKIGIGMFAVSQLTKEFKIITKTKGSNFRTITHIQLNTHSEDLLKKRPGEKFETGTSKIWRQSAEDKDSHGTEIILLNLLSKTYRELSSQDQWTRSQPDNPLFDEDDERVPPPKYHIGCMLDDNRNHFMEKPELPWAANDSPKEKFESLIQKVIDETGVSYRNPKIELLLDNYLRMIWTLGLQIPVPYIDVHPFEIAGNDDFLIYQLGNKKKAAAKEVKLGVKESLGSKLKLKSLDVHSTQQFHVFMDGVQIFRPIYFRKPILTDHAIKKPLLLVGHYEPDLKKIPKQDSGGNLEFEAYMYWQPKVVPVEHNGVLIRINNANGTLFDSTFMNYPVSEQTRKKQIVAEIFVLEGMDAALNIDRESFNYSHPHYQIITTWLHNAFKQFATVHKKIGKEIRDKRLLDDALKGANDLETFVSEKLDCVRPTDGSVMRVRISNSPKEIEAERRKGNLAYSHEAVLPKNSKGRKTGKAAMDDLLLEGKVRSIAEVLASYGVFEDMPYETQEELLKTIAEIVNFESEK